MVVTEREVVIMDLIIYSWAGLWLSIVNCALLIYTDYCQVYLPHFLSQHYIYSYLFINYLEGNKIKWYLKAFILFKRNVYIKLSADGQVADEPSLRVRLMLGSWRGGRCWSARLFIS